MKTRKTALMILSLAVVLALTLTGCGGASSGSGNSGSGSGAASSASSSGSSGSGKSGSKTAAPQKVTNLTFATGLSGPDGPFMKKLVDNYNKSQKQYHIKFEIHPQNQYATQLDLALKTGKDRPDLALIDEGTLYTYYKKNKIQPMDDLVKKAGITAEDNIPIAWNYDTMGGKLMGFPLNLNTTVMYYNKDLFKAAGISAPPANRQEFMTDIAKLTDKSKGQYGYEMPVLWPQWFIFQNTFFQNGGSFDGGKITYNDKAGVEALSFMKSIIDKGYSPANVQQDGEVTSFLQGKNAIMINGQWMKGQLDKSKINYGVAPVPQWGTVKKGVFCGSANIIVPAQVKDQNVLNGIAQFLKYLDAHEIEWAQSGAAVTSKKTRDSDAYKKLNVQNAVSQESSYLVFPQKVNNWGAILGPLFKGVTDALQGKATPQKALDDAAKKSEQLLKENQ